MLFYRAALPLSSRTLTFVSGIIRRHRKSIGSRWRKVNPGQQALLVLPYLRHGEAFAHLGGGRRGAVGRPAGGGLVQPPRERRAAREGRAGAGDQPGGVLPGEAGEPGGLGERQLDGGDPWRAGLPAAIRDGRVAEGYLQVSVADVAVASRGAARMVLAVAGGGGEAGRQRAPGGAGPELGGGGQGGVPAGARPGGGPGVGPCRGVLAP